METIADAFAAAPRQTGGWAAALDRLAEATGSTGGQRLALGGPFELAFGGPAQPGRAMAALTLSDRPSQADGNEAAAARFKAGESGVAVLRSARDGPVSPGQRTAFLQAAPAILAALRVQNGLEVNAAGHMVRTFEAIDLAAVVLDASGRLRAASRRSREQLGEGGSPRLVDGRLKCAGPEDQRRLDGALAAALDPHSADKADGCRTLALGRSTARDGISIVLTIIRREADQFSISHLPHAIILVRGRSTGAPPEQVVRRAFGLTSGEAAVALQIADGKGRETIAAERGVAPATVQAQLRSIFVKVGVNRELALALKILRLMEI